MTQRLIVDPADYYTSAQIDTLLAAFNHPHFVYSAASLEPLAAEKLQYGSFSYAVGAATKLLVSAWACRIGSGGRIDVRDTSHVLPIRNQTIVGPVAGPPGSAAAFINPALASYADARDTYYDRLNTLATSDLLYVPLLGPSLFHPLLPGPYGIIIGGTTTFDLAWIAPSFSGSLSGLPITNEIGDDGATEYQRVSTQHPFVMSKNWMAGILTGEEKSVGVGFGSVLYYNCTSAWGAVADANTYIFRDDFMGASLDTAVKWTRAESAAGNIEISTAAGTAQWCKTKGNSSWGTNGARSQTTTARVAGKMFAIDVYTGDGTGSSSGGTGSPNLIVGWNNGAGVADTNFVHGVDFTNNGADRALFVFENGVSRGEVGSGYSLRTIYRVRITLGAANAAYEIQGLPEYPAIGGASWELITPGTTSATTTPLAAAFTVNDAVTTVYVGDVKVYT